MKNNFDEIIKKLTLIYGSFNEEIVEQKLSYKYLEKDDIVLEIGGNMGRNALVVSEILEKDNNFVTIEPNNQFYLKLTENKKINNKNFFIENSALSLTPLYYKDSLTYSDEISKEKFPVSTDHIQKSNNCLNKSNIISYNELKEKYKLNFNVLLVDCEGSFYYILKDMEYILDNIKLIIMENDYENVEHYKYIKNLLLKRKFYCIESIPLCGYPNNCPWDAPCKENFYEVWVNKLI